MTSKGVTATAPVNIAAIKYWGKRDVSQILPVNDSLSFTLSQDDLCATTSVMTAPVGSGTKMWLNGELVSVEGNKRVQAVIQKIQELAKQQGTPAAVFELPLRIASVNNFPTAAGLASSAAGYAALTTALGALYNVSGNLSAIARIGSGSACRSVHGGFVKWLAGTSSEDSIAVQVAPMEHWPELRFLVCVARSTPKPVGSTDGMQRTLETSKLMSARTASIPGKMATIEAAIRDRDFPVLAEITMRDSNQLHAVCLDTFPPLAYMNDASHRIATAVHEYNRVKGRVTAGYTFDAGPNACLLTEGQENFDELAALVQRLFKAPEKKPEDFWRGTGPAQFVDVSAVVEKMEVRPMPGGVDFVIGTKLGGEPRVVTYPTDSLLNSDGELAARS